MQNCVMSQTVPRAGTHVGSFGSHEEHAVPHWTPVHGA
jgi:hypothetical protein